MTRLVDAGPRRPTTGTRRPTRASSRRRSSRSSSARATRRTSRPGTTCSSRASRSSRRTRSPRAPRSGTCSPPTARRRTAARTRRPASTTCSKLITDHVKVQDKSGREALQNFIGGNGDVLLSYEYEAITASKKGEDARLRDPGRHDQDQHRHRDDQGRAAAGADVPRLRALQARRRSSFADWGYRPVNEEVLDGQQGQVPRRRPACSRSTTSAAGRRSTTSSSTPRSGSIAKIEEDAGVSTAK